MRSHPADVGMWLRWSQFPRAKLASVEWPGSQQMVSEFMVKTEDLCMLRTDMFLRDAAQCMIARDVTGAPVLDEDNRLVGVLSRTDLINQIAGKMKFIHRSAFAGPKSELFMQNVDLLQSVKQQRVGYVMSPAPVTVTSTATMQQAAAIMARKKLNRLMVLDKPGGSLVGMVSSTDVVKLALCDEKGDTCDASLF